MGNIKDDLRKLASSYRFRAGEIYSIVHPDPWEVEDALIGAATELINDESSSICILDLRRIHRLSQTSITYALEDALNGYPSSYRYRNRNPYFTHDAIENALLRHRTALLVVLGAERLTPTLLRCLNDYCKVEQVNYDWNIYGQRQVHYMDMLLICTRIS